MKHLLISAFRRLFAKGRHAQTVGKWESSLSFPDITPLPCVEFQVWAHLPIYDEHSSRQKN